MDGRRVPIVRAYGLLRAIHLDAGAFDRMEDYRRWCEQELPSWLGYGREV